MRYEYQDIAESVYEVSTPADWQA
ncbi:protein of unknown function [Vibrio tapetis subsp. tapetis]|uniref:Uncharacterized protein n=1 Tax=Vibrio tapetis subsp. tapetis TaxID=1671868 RepID=A0A2N8ZIC2_9VIBR|nr:protein of unknown function [Vibrio tapetis subsp. tapetis]